MAPQRMIMHPAWQAAHELLGNPEKWFRTVVIERDGYSDAQVAGAMRLMGYGDDLVVFYEGVHAVGYELPAKWIPVNQNESLDAYPGLMETVKAIVELPTLEDALADPAGFAAGFELADQGEYPLPPGALSALNGRPGATW